MMEIQLKLERKFQKFENLSFEHWLYAVIGACAIQALAQFLTIKQPDPWQEKTELSMFGDPVFYIGLMLTMLISLLIIRRWKRLESM